MKDSQQAQNGERDIAKYIKADNERFSTRTRPYTSQL